MEKSSIALMSCPECGSEIKLISGDKDNSGFVKEGALSCISCSKVYTIKNYIPRFVNEKNYANNFGFEWLRHSKIQIDKYTGMNVSEKRLYHQSGWSKSELKGKTVLEAGCGGGRFSDPLLKAGADLYSFDYSIAVDANQENNGVKRGFNLCQADIYKIPFKSFDYIICYGVLQHTPNPKKSFMSLARHLKNGGKISIDIYPMTLKNMLHPKYTLRLILKAIGMRKDYERLYSFLKNYWVPMFWPISNFVKKLPLLGRTLKNMIPVDNFTGELPTKNKKLLKEWAILNTFDWLSPEYDLPQTVAEVRNWFREAGLKNIHVYLDKNIIIGNAQK